jgi:hypothetical protein
LFSIITKYIYLFSDSKVRKKLARGKKELEEAEKDKKFLTCYIAVMRKKEEEAWRKKEAEAQRRRPGGRRPSRTWWWPDGTIMAKASRMSDLGGSSHPRVIQGLPLLLLVFMYLLLNGFCCKYMLNLCEQLNKICICMNMI